jgi:nitrous oxidase accessory protein
MLGSVRASHRAALALLAGVVCGPLAGAQHAVAPGTGTLAAAIAGAAPGDHLVLVPGLYRGRVIIDRPLTVSGQPGATVDGGGEGRTITVDAPDVVVRGLTVTGSGLTLASEDTGIFVTARGDRALVESNRLQDNLIGVYLKGPDAAVVRGNHIIGRRDLRSNERGNGIQLWNTPRSVIEDNRVRFGRDGIFVTTSRHNLFKANRFDELRFAIHYMYTNDSEVNGNISRGNHIGYAIMFSHGLTVTGNVSDGDRDRGLLFNYANNSQITFNRVMPGPEKCVFIYNANMNRFHGNHFEGCTIGIHFTAGSEGNEISGNAFVANRTQVKYVGTRDVEWSASGRGNYWSDNVDFDLDGDGIAERPYRPNDIVDQVVWRHPLAKLLLSSAAVQVLRFAQSEFPGLHPGGVTDSAPLMLPPSPGAMESR